MKRFLAFVYEINEPKGGMFDCIGDFNTIEEAAQACINGATKQLPPYMMHEPPVKIFNYVNAYILDSEKGVKCWEDGKYYLNTYKMKWVSTKDSLPNPRQRVLFVVAGVCRPPVQAGMFIEHYEDATTLQNSVFVSESKVLYKKNEISHWMDLPALPNNEPA